MQSKQISIKDLDDIIRIIGGCNLNVGPWIAGGTPRRLWYSEIWKEHDVDIFFPNKLSFEHATTRLEKAAYDSIEADHLYPSNTFARQQSKFETENAISFKIQLGHSLNIVKVQAIRCRWYDNLRELWDNFDLSACKFATDGEILLADDDAIEGCDNKILRYNQTTKLPVKASRIMKYALYGFDPDAHIVSKLIEQYHNFELNISPDDYGY